MAVRLQDPVSTTSSPVCLAGNLGWLLDQVQNTLAAELAVALEPLGLASRGYCVLAAATEADRTQIELINRSVPFAELEATVAELAAELASIPSSQLAAMKLVVNHAYENMGLASTQTLGPILDGLMRNTPEAKAFIEKAEREGVRSVVAERDGRFGDYSQAPAELRPDPANVIVP